MRKIFAIVVTLGLLGAASLPMAVADMMRRPPGGPPWPEAVERERGRTSYSFYVSATAGVVGVAMTISLVALRILRKKS